MLDTGQIALSGEALMLFRQGLLQQRSMTMVSDRVL